MVNYANGKIYKITNDIDDKVYYGSTARELYKRMYDHRTRAKINKERKSPLYQHMRSLGIEHFKILLIEEYPCKNKIELNRREGELIKRDKPTLNYQIAGRTLQEYRKDNIEKLKEYDKNRGQKNLICECGKKVSQREQNRHRKSKKHLDIVNILLK